MQRRARDVEEEGDRAPQPDPQDQRDEQEARHLGRGSHHGWNGRIDEHHASRRGRGGDPRLLLTPREEGDDLEEGRHLALGLGEVQLSLRDLAQLPLTPLDLPLEVRQEIRDAPGLPLEAGHDALPKISGDAVDRVPLPDGPGLDAAGVLVPEAPIALQLRLGRGPGPLQLGEGEVHLPTPRLHQVDELGGPGLHDRLELDDPRLDLAEGLHGCIDTDAQAGGDPRERTRVPCGQRHLGTLERLDPQGSLSDLHLQPLTLGQEQAPEAEVHPIEPQDSASRPWRLDVPHRDEAAVPLPRRARPS